MLSYSFYILLMFSFITSIVIVLDVSLFRFIAQDIPHIYGDFDNRLHVWGMIMWMFFGIPLGAIAANIIFSSSSSIDKKMKIFRSSDFDIGWNYTDRSLYPIVFIVSVLLVILFVITMPNEIPFFHVSAGGGVVEAQIIRRNFSFGFDNKLLKSLFNSGTFAFLNLIAFIMALQTHRLKWWMLFIAQFSVMVFLSILSGTIGHILFYLISLAFCRSMVGGKFIKPHELILGCLLLPGLFILFKGATGSLVDVLINSVFSRVLSHLLGTYYSLQIFPGLHDFLWFSSSGRWINEVLTGTSYESYGIILMHFYDPAGVAAGHAGHLTSIFLAEAWANFGIFGIIVAPLWVGLSVQLVNRFFIGRTKSVTSVALYAYLATTFGYASDFVGFYYPFGTILFILGTFIILFLPKLLMTRIVMNKTKVKLDSLMLIKIGGGIDYYLYHS
ncbi:MAG: hypothetical protein C0403_06785 [Desulfobacterium sp.]|nr:hypothetical protein [Desulfobacterium sp.]